MLFIVIVIMEHWLKKYYIRHKELGNDDVVLLDNTRRKKDMSRKLVFKWIGMY